MHVPCNADPCPRIPPAAPSASGLLFPYAISSSSFSSLHRIKLKIRSCMQLVEQAEDEVANPQLCLGLTSKTDRDFK